MGWWLACANEAVVQFCIMANWAQRSLGLNIATISRKLSSVACIEDLILLFYDNVSHKCR